MASVRDPITGAKTGGFRGAAGRVVYANMATRPEPPPSTSRPPSPSRPSRPTSVSQVQYDPKSPSPPPNNVAFYNQNNSTPRYPKPKARSPSPHRSMKPQNNKPSGPHQNSHGYHSRYAGNNRHGSAYHQGQTHQGAQWPQRRCCTLVWALLLLLLLAALAAGIYFLVQYVQQQNTANAPDQTNPGGYYDNGLYIVTSVYADSESLGIFGHDRPCNPFNNNTIGDDNVTNPDCDTLTTRIVTINVTTTTTTVATTTASAHILTSCLFSVVTSCLIFFIVSRIHE